MYRRLFKGRKDVSVSWTNLYRSRKEPFFETGRERPTPNRSSLTTWDSFPRRP